jgi:hypothetical protein
MPWDLDVAAIWAETGKLAAEDAADAENLARRGLLGELAAADAGIRGRRGPGQPGSARRVPGSSGSPAGGFGAGCRWMWRRADRRRWGSPSGSPTTRSGSVGHR